MTPVLRPLFSQRDLDCMAGVSGGAVRPAADLRQHLLFKQFTGRTVAPTGPLHEAWLVVGRRGGKSFILAVVEVINAIKPGMATIPGSMLLCANSPHARRGALWEAYRKHFGQMAIRCSCGRLAPAPFECDRAAGLHRCAHGGRPGLCAGRVS